MCCDNNFGWNALLISINDLIHKSECKGNTFFRNGNFLMKKIVFLHQI